MQWGVYLVPLSWGFGGSVVAMTVPLWRWQFSSGLWPGCFWWYLTDVSVTLTFFFFWWAFYLILVIVMVSFQFILCVFSFFFGGGGGGHPIFFVVTITWISVYIYRILIQYMLFICWLNKQQTTSPCCVKLYECVLTNSMIYMLTSSLCCKRHHLLAGQRIFVHPCWWQPQPRLDPVLPTMHWLHSQGSAQWWWCSGALVCPCICSSLLCLSDLVKALCSPLSIWPS